MKKNVRLLFLFLVLVIVTSVFAVCESNAGSLDVTAPKKTITSGQTFKVIWSCNMPASDLSYNWVFAKKLAELAYKHSNGQIVFQIFPGSQLGGDVSVLEQIQMGTVTGTSFASPNLADGFPQIQVFSLPYVFGDFETAVRILGGDSATGILKKCGDALGLHIAGAFVCGYRGVTNNVRAINSVNDFKGLKIRVPGTRVLFDTLEAFGANAITIQGGGDVYPVVQAGTVDGQESTLAWALGQGFAEIQKYMTYTNHNPSITPVFYNLAWYKSLPHDMQEALDRASREACDYVTGYCFNAELNIKTSFKTAGCVVTELNPDDIKPLMSGIWKKYADICGGMNVINALIADGKLNVDFK